jgi:DNA-binding CsgD family transcriptional regulator
MPMSKPLSARELEVLKQVAEGKENREIAQIMGISVRTVEAHRARAMLKLKLTSVADVVKYAIREHLVEA